jgi:hypothetical protein
LRRYFDCSLCNADRVMPCVGFTLGLDELRAQFVESGFRPVENGGVAALRQWSDEIDRRSLSVFFGLFDLPSEWSDTLVCGGPMGSGVLGGGLRF